MENAINSIPHIWSVLDTAPQTMIHNDCNPRNMCLRKFKEPTIPNHPPLTSQTQPGSGFVPYSDPRRVCIYDWELATIAVPQHDLAEFLAFTLQPSSSVQTWTELTEFYRQHLQHYSDMEFPVNRLVSHSIIASTAETLIPRLNLSSIGMCTLHSQQLHSRTTLWSS